MKPMVHGIQTVCRYLFVVGVIGILLFGLQWQFGSRGWNELSVMIWMPAGAVLLYITTHLLNPRNRAWFYILQVIGITLVQFSIGAAVFERGTMINLFPFIGTLGLISILAYVNLYLAFLVRQRPPIWFFLIGPIGLGISTVYHGEENEFLYLLMLILFTNLIIWNYSHMKKQK